MILLVVPSRFRLFSYSRVPALLLSSPSPYFHSPFSQLANLVREIVREIELPLLLLLPPPFRDSEVSSIDLVTRISSFSLFLSLAATGRFPPLVPAHSSDQGEGGGGLYRSI